MSKTFNGTANDDVLLGTSGDDTFYASGGTDRVWGGTGGTDTLALTGSISDYSFTENADGTYCVRDLRDGAPDGEITFRAIDQLDMNGDVFSLDEVIAYNKNLFHGTSEDDTLLGTAEDDVFYASDGNDHIWGGVGGTDKLVLSGAFANYSVKDNGNGSYTLTEMRDGSPVNSMVVRDIETFEFADGVLDIQEMLDTAFNEIKGTDGNDTLIGSVGDDSFVGGAGDDTIWGHNSGEDLASYTGNFADYKIYAYGDGRFLIKDMRTGAENDGQDTVRNIEMFEFADRTVSLKEWLDSLPIIPTVGNLGDEGDNILHGSDGDDVMQAFGGNDRIWAGEAGDDTVVFRGNFEDYIVTDNGNGSYTVLDTREGSPDGTNVVRGFEHFHFADKMVEEADVLDGNNGTGFDRTGTAAADSFDGAHIHGLFNAYTNDVLTGKPNADLLKGGPGDDIIFGDKLPAPQALSVDIVYKDVGSDLPTFDFNGTLYQVINGQIKSFNPDTGAYENIGKDHPNINAVGMNSLDGYAYGIGTGGNLRGDLLRIGADGNIETVATGFQRVASGTFDNQGNLVMRTDNDTLTSVNVETLEVQTFDFTGGSARSVYDLVFIDDGAAGKFYGINKFAQLVVFDMNTQEMTVTPIEGIDVTGAFGAGWSVDGDLYFSHNRTGNIYGISGIDTDSPSGGLLTPGQRSYINDGFSFNDADLPDQFQADGSDYLQGGLGNDELHGGNGNDFLNGGEGADALFGDDGFDYADYSHATTGVVMSLATGGRSGQAEGDSYTDVEGVVGSDFADTLEGDDGDNDLLGYGGDDTLVGGAGADHLWGENGNDTLIGGAGADVLRGGAGNDVFVIGNRDEGDVITDFVQGEDLIDLTAIEGSSFNVLSFVFNWGDDPVSGFDDLTFTDQGDGSVLVSYEESTLFGLSSETYSFEVQGLDGAALTADDFIF